MKDTYHTISEPAEGLFKAKGSKFISYLYPIQEVTEAEDLLQKIRSDHPKANHHCYAFRLGKEGKTWRSNDDGEPSGTAGRPILGQLKSAELTHVICIVVRYFGGTKLGVSGLIEAYREGAIAAIQNATIIRKTLKRNFNVQCTYADFPMLMEALKYADIDIRQKTFDKKPSLKVSIPLSEISHKWQLAATHFIGHSASKKDLTENNIEIKELDIV